MACAQARLKNGSRYFTVCLYDPFGNISGQFRSNVLSPIASASVRSTSSLQNATDQPAISSSLSNSTTTEPSDCDWPTLADVSSDKPSDVPSDLISKLSASNPSVGNSFTSNTTSQNPPESELPNEATLNVSPQGLPNEPNEPPRPSTLVKPILNKSYRLSPGMLVKLKNLNRRKLDASADRNAGADDKPDKLEASASELNTFIKLNTISPTLDTMEISNLISRKNESSSVSATQTEPTTSVGDDLWTTTRPL